MAHLYLGIMSGTSMDGIDIALLNFKQRPATILDYATYPFPEALIPTIHGLCQPNQNEINTMGDADRQIAHAFADAVKAFLARNQLTSADIVAIGSHGQTIRHYPDGNNGFTLQIGDPFTLASKTDIDVIADFRRKDVALGGQGAPLVPAFHKAMFATKRCNRVVLNIGGISNITYLPADQQTPIVGFDTGPGNTLMDAWCRKHTGQQYDKSGAWASQGKPDNTLLQAMLTLPFFSQPAPKSTGRELFNLAWLEQQLSQYGNTLSPESVQATLALLTATSIADQIHALPDVEEVYVCGGGAHNDFLMETLETLLYDCQLNTTDELGIVSDAVEAAAFAWLAYAHKQGIPGNIPSVTGASRSAILGASFSAL
ncbi:anhydro-N-acetylmuramic acid kinase [Aestuariibacter sp. AA17]|uniref:Anhydro-N-acetylmuramic acid kinase n=1 Tax=Fluctibacter corallii TaxID=2984329 RepID=A0ABT3A5T3_9ALTE|nr:anhydro-N-acetylmuramic acid kinase [Aestuariibacter sp. AA17]MCV2883711.1 anhydro-N-acetylmuramic acid kinase [Aestuariibacter sp. AA17]